MSKLTGQYPVFDGPQAGRLVGLPNGLREFQCPVHVGPPPGWSNPENAAAAADDPVRLVQYHQFSVMSAARMAWLTTGLAAIENVLAEMCEQGVKPNDLPAGSPHRKLMSVAATLIGMIRTVDLAKSGDGELTPLTLGPSDPFWAACKMPQQVVDEMAQPGGLADALLRLFNRPELEPNLPAGDLKNLKHWFDSVTNMGHLSGPAWLKELRG